MGMFSRMSDIVQANINAMLDKAEDPEKVIRLIIQEMEETLVEIRTQAATYIAEQKHLDRKLERLQKDSKSWQQKAELAMDKDKESLARAALLEKQKCEAARSEVSGHYQQLTEMLEKIQDDTGRLQSKLAEAKAKQKSLVARKNTAAVRLKARNVDHSDKIQNAMSRFEQYEQRIDYLEAQVDSYDVVSTTNADPQSLNAQFAALTSDDDVEKELEAMRKKRVA
ncbi:phage shock protein PspA [Alteromonas halophila]|uniref:Phage shock protein PspA n=1 Tax=Alteromonas halophila TaxID=516698 RepID=A0A918JNJ9_9ALTE|nr:phage shock protein PspA [Alteromonas halophila]GGW91778.1 phage shock protein PspA [Alteromonas halophila]